MPDQWTEKLSMYLDGELNRQDERLLDEHLADCEDCGHSLEQLRQVKRWATTYSGEEPSADVWTRVEEGVRRPPLQVMETAGTIAPRGNVGLRAFRLPPAIAAGIVLMAVAAGSWWMARATAPAAPTGTIPVTWEPAVGASAHATLLAAERYGSAVAQLENELMNGDMTLDTATIRVLRQKLAVIDRAIDEARQAVARDPNSGYLAEHFARMMRQKLALLRNTARVAVVQS